MITVQVALIGHIIAAERTRVPASGELELEHDMAVVAEGGDPAGQIELPHAQEPLVIEPIGLKTLEALGPATPTHRISPQVEEVDRVLGPSGTEVND